MKLTEKEVELLINIISQSELFVNNKIEDCKQYYGMTQKTAKKKAQGIIRKIKAFYLFQF